MRGVQVARCAPLASPRTVQSGRQFSWSWTCEGEPSGTIEVRTESDAVVLTYRVSSVLAKPMEQRVPITWTNGHFGGRRPWFLCLAHSNGQHCGRRVAVLYGAGELFACRRCYGLVYASQQEGLWQHQQNPAAAGR